MSVANHCQESSSPEKEEATSVYVGHHLPNISNRLFLLFIWLIQLENSFIVTDAAVAESLTNKALLFKNKSLNADGESDEEPADCPIKFKFTTTDNERETIINSKKDVLFMCLGGLNDFASNKAETLFYTISALVWFLREFQNNALFNYTFDFSSKELGFKHYVNGILTSFVPFDAECSTNHAADMLKSSMEIKGFTSFAETFTKRCEIATTVHPRSAVAKKRIVYDDTITDFPSTVSDVSNLNDGSIKRVNTLNERNALIASKKSIVFFTGFEVMDKERSATSCFIECFQEHPNLIYCFDYTNPDSVSFDFYTHGTKVRQVLVSSPTTPYDRIKACVESAIKDVVNSILKHLGNGPYTIDGPVTVDASINGSDLFEECKKLNEGGQITVKIHEDAVKLLECAKKYGHMETEKRLKEFIADQFT